MPGTRRPQRTSPTLPLWAPTGGWGPTAFRRTDPERVVEATAFPQPAPAPLVHGLTRPTGAPTGAPTDAVSAAVERYTADELAAAFAQVAASMPSTAAAVLAQLEARVYAALRSARQAPRAPAPVALPGTAPALPPGPMPAPAPAPAPDVPTVAPSGAWVPGPMADTTRTRIDSLATATFKPSPYQVAIFQWLLEGTGHAVVEAVAGSGKTTTILQAASLIPAGQTAIFVAFSTKVVKHIQQQLDARHITTMRAQTMNSVGNQLVGKKVKAGRRVEEAKARKLVKLHAQQCGWFDSMGKADAAGIVTALVDLLHYARVTLCDTASDEALRACADHFGIDDYDPSYERLVFSALRDLLQEDLRLAQLGTIDFDDQLWLPAVWGLIPDQYDWVMVDECQDLSAAQLALARKCVKPGTGRLIFVGDRFQSIFGFAGADEQSVERIISETGATTLPLSVCYRCHVAALRLAQEIVPSIQPREGAPEGLVAHISPKQLAATLAAGDMLLCRLTAPLIAQCLTLLAQGLPAIVVGRDVSKTLFALIDEVCRSDTYAGAASDSEQERYARFGLALEQHCTRLVAKLSQRDGSERQIEALHDKVDAVRALYESPRYEHCQTIDALKGAVNSLFIEDGDEHYVQCSTVHRAKGLEADRVFIIRPEKLPLTHPGQQGWEKRQEQNLLYVALTRPKQALYFVDQPDVEPTAGDADGDAAGDSAAAPATTTITVATPSGPATVDVSPEHARLHQQSQRRARLMRARDVLRACSKQLFEQARDAGAAGDEERQAQLWCRMNLVDARLGTLGELIESLRSWRDNPAVL